MSTLVTSFNVKENSIAETIHLLLSKSKNPKLSCEEIENIFQDISRIFVEKSQFIFQVKIHKSLD